MPNQQQLLLYFYYFIRKEELEQTGRVLAWIEEDVINMIEEAREEMEEAEALKEQYKAAKEEKVLSLCFSTFL